MIHSITALPAFQDNYIWALENTARDLCVVDPGDPQPVIDYVESHGGRLEAILITHHHPDHTGGISTLVEKYACEVIGPNNPSIAGITRHVKQGDTLEVIGQSFTVWEVPGHTLDHIAFATDARPADSVPPRVFSGDTLFAGGCGRLFEGSPGQMLESLGKLVALGVETEIYCTHEYTQANLAFASACEPGNLVLGLRSSQVAALRAAGKITLPTTMGLELATNPFLRTSHASVIQAAERFAGSRPSDSVATFAAIRAWKDEF